MTLRSRRFVLPFLFLTAMNAAEAQRDRIPSAIDSSRRVFLRGNVHPDARPQFDRGAVPSTFPVRGLTMYLRPSSAQQSALEQLLAQQQDPSSVNYHKWISPEEYADRFGASQS